MIKQEGQEELRTPNSGVSLVSSSSSWTLGSTSATSRNGEIEPEVQVVQKPIPIPQFVEGSETSESQLQESTTPACVFRKHLELAKNEGKALQALYDNIKTESENDALSREANEEEPSWLPPIAGGLDAQDRVSLQEVVSHPKVAQLGKYLVCSCAALPVFSLENVKYILNTVLVDESSSLQLAVRLEVVCNVREAESLFHKLKHPFLHNMEPGSVWMIREPVFDRDSPDECFRIRTSNVRDVAFLPHPTFQSVISLTLLPTRDVSELQIAENDAKTDDSSKVSLWASSTVEDKLAADEWKRWANEYSAARLYCQALFAYDIALRFDPTNVELVASRSTTLINLGLYTAARENVEFITLQDPNNTGYILRKVNCLWGLEKYEETHEYLRSLLARQAASLNAVEDAGEVSKRSLFIEKIVEKTTKLMQLAKSGVPADGPERFFKSHNRLFYDEPEYYKPVTILHKVSDNANSEAGSNKSSSGSSSSVIANREIQGGELLVQTKAFSVVFLDSAISNLLFFGEGNDELANLAVLKLKLENPTEASIYKLDTATTSLESLVLDASVNLSQEYIRTFCETHFYVGSTHSEGSSSQSYRAIGGLWTYPMHIRHACVGGNAVWFICGNMMFIRAIRDIKMGEELVMAHVEPTLDFETRKQFLSSKGIVCSCPLCQFESKEPDHVKVKRRSIVKGMRDNGLLSNSGPTDLTKHELRRLKHCIEDMEILRSAYPKLNFPIVDPTYNYGLYLIGVNEFEEAVFVLEKAFYVVDDTSAIFDLLNISLHLSYCYTARKKGKDKTKAKKWFNAMVGYALISYGCLDPVRQTYRSIFEFLERKGITTAYAK